MAVIRGARLQGIKLPLLPARQPLDQFGVDRMLRRKPLQLLSDQDKHLLNAAKLRLLVVLNARD